MPALPHQFLTIDPCTVAFATLPAVNPHAATVVWLHGLGAASTITFADVAQFPALGGISSILIDLPGAGHSSAPNTWGGTIENLAAIALRAIERLAKGAVVLFGHSLGGSVAIAAASQRPDLIQHLIVGEPNLDPGVGTISVTIARQTEGSFVAHGYPRLIAATIRLARQGKVNTGWVRTLRMADPRQLHRAATSLLIPREPTFRQQLGDLPMPTSVVTGHLTPPLEVPLPQRPNLAGYVVPDAGHQMFSDNPAAFATLLAKIVSNSGR